MTAKEIIEAYEGLSKEDKEEVHSYLTEHASAKPGKGGQASAKEMESAVKPVLESRESKS